MLTLTPLIEVISKAKLIGKTHWGMFFDPVPKLQTESHVGKIPKLEAMICAKGYEVWDTHQTFSYLAAKSPKQALWFLSNLPDIGGMTRKAFDPGDQRFVVINEIQDYAPDQIA